MPTQMKIAVLPPVHVSPETAFLVQDYPYGFRLRCKIKYWLEVSKTKGVRFCSQTTNPKKPGDVWNKPKYSTYYKFGGAMFLNEQNHVVWTGIHEYMDTPQIKIWMDNYQEGNVIPEITNSWFKAKQVYDEKRSEGRSMLESGIVATPVPRG